MSCSGVVKSDAQIAETEFIQDRNDFSGVLRRRADENIEIAGETRARMKGEAMSSDDQVLTPWEFSNAINSFESLLRGMV